MQFYENVTIEAAPIEKPTDTSGTLRSQLMILLLTTFKPAVYSVLFALLFGIFYPAVIYASRSDAGLLKSIEFASNNLSRNFDWATFFLMVALGVGAGVFFKFLDRNEGTQYYK